MEDRTHFASYLGYLLRRASLHAGQVCEEDQSLAAGQVPPDLWSGHDSGYLRDLAMLLVLDRTGPMSQQALAKRLTINRSVMVKLIDALEAEGHVVRARNAADRRSYALEVTPAGREHMSALFEVAREVSRRMCEELSQRETKRFTKLMRALVAPSLPKGAVPEELLALPVWLIVTAQEQMGELGDACLAPLGLTVRTYVALAVLSGTSLTQAELAAHMMIGPAATVDLVDELERRAAVLRTRGSKDRRTYLLSVTPSGAELAVGGRALIADAASSFAASLEETDHEELLGLLERVAGPLPSPSVHSTA